jgi:hypothetical protein
MALTWKYVKTLNDPMAVKTFLNKNNLSLPKSLIEILEKYNGGRPSDKMILTEAKREYVFKSILSYNEDDKENIYNIYMDLFKRSEYFPFASDAAGNFICYDIKTGKLVLYNHETNNVEIILKFPLVI